MKLSDAERGMLLSKMGDETVASIFGKSAGWVRRARIWLAEEAAKPPEPRNCAKQEKAPRSVREAPDPKPAPARKLAGKSAIQIIADEIKTASDGFDKIEAMFISGPSNEAAKIDTPADDTAYVETVSTGARDVYTFSTLSAARATISAVKVVRFLGEPGQTFMGGAGPPPPAEPAKAAPAAAQRRRDPDPRVTKDLLRWVGWFVAAKWTWREISELFEIEADVLRDALTPAESPA